MARINPTERYTVASRDTEVRLPARFTNHRFQFVHFPRGWVFHEGANEYLPNPGMVVAMKGANGIGETGNMAPAIGGAMAKGGAMIMDTDERLGDHIHYVGRTRCVGGGWHNAFYADGFTQLGPNDFTLEHDRETWLDFLRTIKTSGIIQPMDEMVYRTLIRAQESHIRRISTKQNPRESHIEAAEQKLVAMKEAWVAEQALILEDKAEPKKTRSRRKAISTKSDA